MSAPPVDDDDWSGSGDMERICALAAEVTTTLRPRACWMSQTALVLLATELVTTMFADLVPPDDVGPGLSSVIEGLHANIVEEIERQRVVEAGEVEGPR